MPELPPPHTLHEDEKLQQAVLLFEEADRLHKHVLEVRKELTLKWRRMRYEGMMRAPRSQPAPDRKIFMEQYAARAEADHQEADDAVRAALEVMRMRRDQLGAVRSEMANRREEMGGVMKQGAYHGA